MTKKINKENTTQNQSCFYDDPNSTYDQLVSITGFYNTQILLEKYKNQGSNLQHYKKAKHQVV